MDDSLLHQALIRIEDKLDQVAERLVALETKDKVSKDFVSRTVAVGSFFVSILAIIVSILI